MAKKKAVKAAPASALYPDLGKAKFISVDVETKDPDIKTTRLAAIRKTGYVIGFSVGTDDGFKKYYPIRHPGEGNLDEKKTIAWLKAQMKNNVPKVGANILYDMEWLWFDMGVELHGRKICIQMTEALIDENRTQYSLDALARDYLNKTKDERTIREAAVRAGIKPDEVKANLWKLPAEDVRAYGEADASLPIEIHLLQLPKIKDAELGSVYDLECDVTEVLFEMRRRGIRIDEARAAQIREQFTEQEKISMKEIEKIAGWEVDIWSGQDLERAAKKLGLPFPVTAKNNPSFNSPWMEAQSHPFFKSVRAARKINRANETFVKSKIIDLVHNGRIYPSYFSTRNDRYGTVTGRLSSAGPNMQQVPARDKETGPLIRSIFLPEEGEEFEVYDYSQQEPRVTVHYASISGLPGASIARDKYNKDPDTDYHQMVADMAGLPGADGRKKAKTINLGLAYGMGKQKLAEQLEMTFEEADGLFRQYHKAVPFMKALSDKCTRLAEQRGFIKTILGRRRHFDMFGPAKYEKDMKPMRYEEALAFYGPCIKRWFVYKAMNTLIQGSSAEITKKAMVDVYKETKKIPLLTVHDENDYSNSDRKLSRTIHGIMISCVKLEVPLKVDYEVGPNWGDCRKAEL